MVRIFLIFCLLILLHAEIVVSESPSQQPATNSPATNYVIAEVEEEIDPQTDEPLIIINIPDLFDDIDGELENFNIDEFDDEEPPISNLRSET